METNHRDLKGVVILADESAEWRVAGLRQLDRLALALNECSRGSNSSDRLPVLLQDARAVSRFQELAQDRRLVHLSVTDNADQFSAETQRRDGEILVLNTRLVVERGAFARISAQTHKDELPFLLLPTAEVSSDAGFFSRSSARITAAAQLTRQAGEWTYLREASEIPAAEKQLLRASEKSQDGFVSRFLNRPISRGLSRFLLRVPVSPNQWTIIALAIPIAGAIALMRGDRWGLVIGAILFQLVSVLDGCDGEIARLKYLDSEWGAKLDGICDRLATMLLCAGLGFGLSRQAQIADAFRSFYLWEGIMAALLLGISETLLQRTPIEEDLERDGSENIHTGYVRKHRESFNAGDQLKIWAMKHSGMLRFGERLTTFFVQVTKRDVFNLAFALLILCGWPQAVLHILAAVALAIGIFALRHLLTAASQLRSARTTLTAGRGEQLSSAEEKSAV